MLVTGSGSVLNAFNSLQIGDTSCGCGLVGTLTIADGGVVNSPGATSIGAGSTLNLGIGGLAGAIVTPAIANDGQIVANFTDTSTLSANVSGAGALSKAGAGTLIPYYMLILLMNLQNSVVGPRFGPRHYKAFQCPTKSSGLRPRFR